MKKIIYLLLIAMMANSYAIVAHNKPAHLIPYPKHMVHGNGEYTLPSNVKWQVANDEQRQVAQLWSSLINCQFSFVQQAEEVDIIFSTDATMQPEAYKMIVGHQGIHISAAGKEGFFYALQSLMQFLPVDNSQQLTIPHLVVDDAPRFEYRGVMLDVSRFFIPKENVLRIIDCMASLKLNKLHFHLTDDNGWRLQIDKHPKLTEVGAWRVDRKENFPARANPKLGEPTPVGGYYTKDDIREIVAFASARMVEVIPEIEMPAHAIAALASYPQLACPIVDKYIGVLPGIGGLDARIIFCAGNDDVFTFIEEVLDEVMELFPSQYIHLGGDEAQKYYWERCPKCKQRMHTEGIHEVEELQSYFMNRVSKYVQSKGKQVMGWDELTNSTLPQDVIIFGWQGQGQAAIKAAKQGHKFVMTPAQVLYFIRYQGPQWFEPYTYFGNNTLANVYNYEPIQASWAPEYADLLMGIQGSMWTEFCSSPQDVEHQLFPRLIALSEIAWTSKEHKNWESFLLRLDSFLPRLDNKNITYAKSMYNIDHLSKPNEGKLDVQLSCIRPDVEIRYTLDGTAPNAQSPLYKDMLQVANSTVLKSATFQQGKQMGQVLTLDLNFNLATGKAIKTNSTANHTLTNGVRGSNKHSDFEWAGWYDKDASLVIDFSKTETISEVQLGSITNFSMGVHKPKTLTLWGSEDGENYKKIKEIKFLEKAIFQPVIRTEMISFGKLKAQARYLKIEFKNPGHCPPSNIRGGMPNWVYFDELIVK